MAFEGQVPRGGSPPLGRRVRARVLVFDETQFIRVALFPFPQSHIFARLLSLLPSLLFFTRRHLRVLCVVVCSTADVWYGVETENVLHLKTLLYERRSLSHSLSLSL